LLSATAAAIAPELPAARGALEAPEVLGSCVQAESDNDTASEAANISG
jgi:hypothetical protein